MFLRNLAPSSKVASSWTCYDVTWFWQPTSTLGTMQFPTHCSFLFIGEKWLSTAKEKPTRWPVITLNVRILALQNLHPAFDTVNFHSTFTTNGGYTTRRQTGAVSPPSLPSDLREGEKQRKEKKEEKKSYGFSIRIPSQTRP